MTIRVGDAVELVTSSTSTAGGSPTAMGAGLVGRVCRIYPSGFCCVRFAGIDCRKVHQKRLRPTTRTAPQCTPDCRRSC